MPRISIDTKKSLYKPIEVEIDGKILTVKRITHDIIQKIPEFDERVRNGDLLAAYDRLELFLGKHRVIRTLDLGQVKDITQFIITNIVTQEREEKNVSIPGDKASQ